MRSLLLITQARWINHGQRSNPKHLRTGTSKRRRAWAYTIVKRSRCAESLELSSTSSKDRRSISEQSLSAKSPFLRVEDRRQGHVTPPQQPIPARPRLQVRLLTRRTSETRTIINTPRISCVTTWRHSNRNSKADPRTSGREAAVIRRPKRITRYVLGS